MTHLVTSADGTRIAIFETGNPSGAVVVALHGFPDNHTVWDGVAAELGDSYRVITYDVRGAGASDKPKGRAPYRMERLVEDFTAVLDAVSPDAPVHLLAHDWGSMQSWDFVTDPELARRIVSFTSISGPSLDYVGRWIRTRGHAGTTARQLLASTYMVVFQLPLVPELAARAGVIARGAARVGGGDVHRGLADTTNGVNLYRANVFQRTIFRPRPRKTLVPTLVLVPEGDRFAQPKVVSEAPVGWIDDLTVETIEGRHWVVSEDPARVAAPVAAFIARHVAAPKRKARR